MSNTYIGFYIIYIYICIVVLGPAMSTPQTQTTEVMHNFTSSTSIETNVEIQWGVVLASLMLVFIIVFGNAVVMTAVLRFHFLQNATNMFVAAVACLDLLFGWTFMFEIGKHLSPNFLNGRLSCVIPQAIGCTNAMASAALLLGKNKQ